jgi:hypothetical protein
LNFSFLPPFDSYDTQNEFGRLFSLPERLILPLETCNHQQRSAPVNCVPGLLNWKTNAHSWVLEGGNDYFSFNIRWIDATDALISMPARVR